jgi:hypothetical protein
VLICFLVVASTILNWGNRRNTPNINDTYLKEQIPNTATNGAGLGQAAPIWTDHVETWAKKTPEKHAEIIKGDGEILEIKRNNLNHIYLIKTDTPLTIQENTLFFPGWTASADQKNLELEILEDTNPKGIFSFNLPEGFYKIEVIFRDTFIFKLGKLISLITLLILIIGVILMPKKNLLK